MRLYTSNSDTAASFNRASIVLMAAVVLCYCCFELGTYYGFHRISRIQARIHKEKAAFLTMRPAASGTPRNIVLVGNSLLLTGIDIPLLNKLGAGKFHYSRLVLESTQYVDWYFGFKRLLNEGAHPDAIVLVFGANHWLAEGVRGEYFAYELMQPLDVFNLARALELNRTTTSNYFFASLSPWLGGRAEIRKFILSNILPDLPRFLGKLSGSPSYPAEDVVFNKAWFRMIRIKALCESHNVRLITVLYPTRQIIAPFDALARAAEAAALPLVVPVAKMAYPSELYADEYHLNAQGMERFTRDLVSPLERQFLSDQTWSDVRLGS